MVSEADELPSRDGGAPPAVPPHRIRFPVNIHRWDNISFLHWAFEPRDIAPLVPDETAVLTYDGMAWVSVTPFFIRMRPPGLPVVPPRWAFPETNVRTYVAGPDGSEGLWFIRMEVPSLWFVATLRSVGLPYFRQRMSVDVEDDRVVYESGSRPSSSGGGHEIVVRPGDELCPPEGGPWERFVTARWGAFHRRGPVLLSTPVEHRSWHMCTAAVQACEVDALFRDAGLPVPVAPPVVHFSPGVTVKVGRPRVVA
ncbi:MAG: DUF2071 domain-containing protein [Actinomycetota bacterium]|nr:DUF2071 domain-containing protein [Actinomycetota bacterium]